VTRLFWLIWDALVDDTDLDDWGPFLILGIPLAALFGAAIGLADIRP
jgi:hypothetical protein